jgi:integrase
VASRSTRTKWTETAALAHRYLPARDPKGSGIVRYWEGATPGFGIRCLRTGARRYIASTTVRGTTATPIITIGEPGKMALKDARSEAVRLLELMRKGVDPRVKTREVKHSDTLLGTTLHEALSYYCKHRRCGEKQKIDVRQFIEKHLASWLNRPMLEIRRRDWRERYPSIAKAVHSEALARYERRKALPAKKRSALPALRKDPDYFRGHCTANAVAGAFATVWNYWMRDHEEDLPKDSAPSDSPTVALRGDRFKKKRGEHTIGDADLKKLYASLPAYTGNKLHAPLFELLMATGLRVGESMALRWEHVRADRIVVPPELSKVDHDQNVDTPFEVPITPAIQKVLDALGELKGMYGDVAYIFASRDAPSGHMEEQHNFYVRLGKHAGVQFSAHDCRRTFATLANRCGITKPSIAALLNHRSAWTMDVTGAYINVKLEERAALIERVGAELARVIELGLQ